MYGTLKKIIAFAGSKEGLLKKSLLFAFPVSYTHLTLPTILLV